MRRGRLVAKDIRSASPIAGWVVILDADLETQREVVDMLLAAARDGRLRSLLTVLDPDR